MWITLRVKEAPERGSFFCAGWRKLSPTAHSFLSCQKRMGRKEALETRNSAYAPEKACRSILRYVVSFPSSKRPSGGPQNFCRLKSCCGKYLCLQNRKVFALNPCRAFRFCPFLIRRLYWLRKRNEPSKKDQRSENPARQRYSRPNGLFFHIFSAKTEKIWPAERRMRLHKLHRALGASEMGLRSKDTPLRCSIKAYY